MKLLLLSNLLWSTLLFSAEQIVFGDKAVFRVDKKVYFKSDLISIKGLFDQFDCFPNSSLQKVIKYNNSNNAKESEGFRTLLLFEKIRKYIRNQEIAINQEKIRTKKSKNCSFISEEVLRIETFLRQRLFKENPSLQEIEFKRFKEDHPNLKGEDLQKAFAQEQIKKRKEEQLLFLSTINKKSESFEFFDD